MLAMQQTKPYSTTNMAMTLLEAAKIAPSIEQSTVIEEYAAQSDILRVLPFENHDGTGIHDNREDTLPGIGFRGINEGYSESVGIVNPQSEAFKIHLGYSRGKCSQRPRDAESEGAFSHVDTKFYQR
jgi:hypothetical protein